MSESKPIDPGVRIGHVHLKVSNLERALGFYCAVLGFQLIQPQGRDAAFVSAGGVGAARQSLRCGKCIAQWLKTLGRLNGNAEIVLYLRQLADDWIPRTQGRPRSSSVAVLCHLVQGRIARDSLLPSAQASRRFLSFG